MKISLFHKSFKDNKKESPLFVRVRGKNSNGVFTSSLISTGVNILPKNFSSGTIKTSTQNYTHKQKIVNTIRYWYFTNCINTFLFTRKNS